MIRIKWPTHERGFVPTRKLARECATVEGVQVPVVRTLGGSTIVLECDRATVGLGMSTSEFLVEWAPALNMDG